jgi:hypothetical protein
MIKNQNCGSETITYYNNRQTLEYLWVQLDQNQAAKTFRQLMESQRMEQVFPAGNFVINFKTRTRARF